jgi:thiol-disulfide isomerase/thioredoxin
MKTLRALFWLFLLICFSVGTSAQGYEIKVKINGLVNKQIILGHYLSKTMYPDDTATLDHNGYGILKGKNKLPGGMYLIYLPSATFFDVVIGEDQFFTIETDTVNFLQSLVFKGSVENQVFLDFQQYFAGLRRGADSLTATLKTENNPSKREALTGKLRLMNSSRIEHIEKIKKDHPDLFVADFLRATLEVPVPDPPRDENGVVIDSNWQYYYYRNHFFDYFDFTDPRLLRTPFYEDKIMQYLNKVVPQIPDTLIYYVDYFINKSKSDSNVFRYMLITLFNYYGKSNIMGMDAVQVHIADKYYINDSWWSDEKFISDLRERTEKAKPLLIGAIAPDVELMNIPSTHFISAKTDTALRRYPHVGTKITLREVPAKYLVLVFWEADCGHCKTIIPELYRIYEKSLKSLNVQVLSVSTLFGEEGKQKWVDFVNKHQLYDWINAWNPYSYDFKLKYDIVTTPQIFILDEHKKIIAKRIGPEQVEDIIKMIHTN